MHRRDFMKLVAATGMSLAVPAFGPRRARATSKKYEGPFLLTVQALGGWDSTMLLDPKADTDGVEVAYAEPTAVAGLPCAPLSLRSGNTELVSVPDFVASTGRRFAIINGLDTQTNSHATGLMHVWSGKASQNLPSLGAVFAAAKLAGNLVAMPYITTAGYQVVGDTVTSARISPLTSLRALRDANELRSGTGFHDPDTMARIQQARAQRDLSFDDVMARGASELRAAQSTGDALTTFLSELPASFPTGAEAFPSLGTFSEVLLNSLLQSVQVAMHAFNAGVAVSANLGMGGFDTHADHELQHPIALARLLLVLQYALRCADEFKLSDRLYVLVGSDFGRTPTYNSRRGKDHWNVTSFLAYGPGIRGGRVIGGTDAELRPLKLEPSAPSKILPHDSPQGTRIYPAHVHRAFRKVAGISETAESQRYPLEVAQPLDDLLL